ncbi:hypothetical protein [Methylobacter psychrophilus]|uniref:hypothetical protein n=1 Tax=Methylobacter psychrophilus TaxID=96941 RepID=UPI0021D51672|nr:hypothetical protein [Methylobacter psychrophilus]
MNKNEVVAEQNNRELTNNEKLSRAIRAAKYANKLKIKTCFTQTSDTMNHSHVDENEINHMEANHHLSIRVNNV